MELSNQPQISSTVLDLCYSIFNSMRTNEGSQIATAKFTKKDRKGTLGRPFFLFRPRNGRTIENGVQEDRKGKLQRKHTQRIPLLYFVYSGSNNFGKKGTKDLEEC
nr:neuromedin-S [Columba livia]XP_021146272.1 neuromedin-S [Columba livia]